MKKVFNKNVFRILICVVLVLMITAFSSCGKVKKGITEILDTSAAASISIIDKYLDKEIDANYAMMLLQELSDTLNSAKNEPGNIKDYLEKDIVLSIEYNSFVANIGLAITTFGLYDITNTLEEGEEDLYEDISETILEIRNLIAEEYDLEKR